MASQHDIDYQRIEAAIAYIRTHAQEQPSLEAIASAVQLSPHHFQRMFSAWAGVSPKKFMQYISLDHAKQLLQARLPLLDTAYETGLSGTGRLHDLFVTIEGMTPGEYKNGGAGLTLRYSYAQTPFGTVIAAATPKGLCHLHFEEDSHKALHELKVRFPRATFLCESDAFQQAALSIFRQDWQQLDKVKLHLAATPFQLKVWESLLKIPSGALASYGDIATRIGQPRASRAVGTAIGSNPIAYLIPCHRVIRSNGALSDYRWGPDKKTALIGWEAAKLET